MPNEIRRSETRKDSYDRLAEALGLTAAKGPGPKFGEDGKAATYHERDADQLPAFTSNLITISHTSAPKDAPVRTASVQRNLRRITSAEEQERDLAVRSAMRHVLAGDDLEVEARNPWTSRTKKDYDSKGPGHVVDENSVVDHSGRPNKRCKGVNFGKDRPDQPCSRGCMEGSDYCSQHAKQASSSSQREVIASITALAPEARIRRDGSFNVIVASTVANLVRGLDIPEAKSEWLAAQAETGLRDDNTFVRDVRSAVESNLRMAQVPQMHDTYRGMPDEAADISGVHMQPGVARDIEFGPKRNLRRKEAVLPEWAMALGEKLFGGYPEVRDAVKAGDPSTVMQVAKGKFPGLADDQLLQVTHAVSALAKKLGRAKEQAKAEMAPAAMGSEEVM